MSRRGRYLGGHTVLGPGQLSPGKDEVVPRAVRQAIAGQAADALIRDRVLAEWGKLRGELSEVERLARTQVLSRAEASDQLVALNLEARFAEVISFYREQKFTERVHRLDEGPEHLRWLMGELADASRGLMLAPAPFAVRTAGPASTERQSPGQAFASALDKALAEGLFSSKYRVDSLAYERAVIQWKFRQYLSAMKHPYPIPARCKSLLLRMDLIGRKTTPGALHRARCDALQRLEADYIQAAEWVGRGQPFSWTRVPEAE